MWQTQKQTPEMQSVDLFIYFCLQLVVIIHSNGATKRERNRFPSTVGGDLHLKSRPAQALFHSAAVYFRRHIKQAGNFCQTAAK